MVIGGTGDSEVLVPGSCRLNSIGAAFMATSPGSSDIRDKVELYIMEVGHVEWTPTDNPLFSRDLLQPPRFVAISRLVPGHQ